MTDEQMISVLKRHAHWTTKEPWSKIADRLEELSKKEKSNQELK